MVPTGISTKATVAEEPEAAAEPKEEDDTTHDDAPEEAVDVEDITRAIHAGQSVALTTALNPAEVAAASAIANAYKRHLTRTRPRPRNLTALQEKRLRIFAAFSAQAQKDASPRRYYRMLFLGPAAHLFLAVELMRDHLYERRNAAKKRFSVAQHLELEAVESSLNHIMYVLAVSKPIRSNKFGHSL